jgi:hypothetical protein
MTIRLEDVIASLPPEQQEAIKRRTEELLVEVEAEGSVKAEVEADELWLIDNPPPADAPTPRPTRRPRGSTPSS